MQGGSPLRRPAEESAEHGPADPLRDARTAEATPSTHLHRPPTLPRTGIPGTHSQATPNTFFQALAFHVAHSSPAKLWLRTTPVPSHCFQAFHFYFRLKAKANLHFLQRLILRTSLELSRL